MKNGEILCYKEFLRFSLISFILLSMIFLYVTNTQTKQQKSENEEKKVLQEFVYTKLYRTAFLYSQFVLFIFCKR
jgi:hypothetical protein